MEKNKVGVIVGRFQTDQLHEGHQFLINKVIDDYENVIIFLGVSPVISNRNPLSFRARTSMVEEYIYDYVQSKDDPFVNIHGLNFKRNVTILPISDHPDDDIWSRNLDQRISEIYPETKAILNGCRDSFIPYYSGKHEVKELDIPECTYDLNASEIRKNLKHYNSPSLDFRRGVIWATQQTYPTAYATVDGLVIDLVSLNILLGKKPDDKAWRFPGGFVDPTDEDYRHAVKREVMEETGAITNVLEQLGTIKINDWRYRSGADKIFSNIFTLEYYGEGTVAAGDDLAQIEWFSLEDVLDDPHSILLPFHAEIITKYEVHLRKEYLLK